MATITLQGRLHAAGSCPGNCWYNEAVQHVEGLDLAEALTCLQERGLLAERGGPGLPGTGLGAHLGRLQQEGRFGGAETDTASETLYGQHRARFLSGRRFKRR